MRLRFSIWWVALAAGCIGDLDPEWQLNHNRIVAVRASPPHIEAGSASVIDALIAHKGGPVSDDAPLAAEIGSDAPTAFAGMTLVAQGSDGSWIVTAPDEAALDAARTELGIAAGSAVPLDVLMAFIDGSDMLPAIKTVELGDSVDNPTLGAVTIGGSAVGSDDTLVIATGSDVPFDIVAPGSDTINWLTSCGTLHDDDEHAAFDNVGSDDPMTGQLVVVDRTVDDGVAWEIWPIHTDEVSGSGSD